MLFHFKNSKHGPSTAGIAVGALFTLFGVAVVMPALGVVGVLWTLAALGILIVNAAGVLGRKGTPAPTGEGEEKPLAPVSQREKDRIRAGAEYAAKMREQFVSRMREEAAAENHDHIPSTAPGPEKQLEQLKTLKSAGLIDEKEYAARRKRIMEEM